MATHSAVIEIPLVGNMIMAMHASHSPNKDIVYA